MTLDLGNTDKLDAFRQELDRLGIKLLPPDINRSRRRPSRSRTTAKTGKRGAIRYALAAVKGVGAQAMEALVAERGRGGRFTRPVRFRAAARHAAASTGASSRAWSRPAPSTASTPTGRRASPPIETAAAPRRAAPPRSATASRRTCSPDRSPALPRARRCRSSPTGRRSRSCRTSSTRSASTSRPPARRRMARASKRARHPALGRLCRPRSPPTAPRAFTLAGIVIGKQERTSARGNRFAFVQLSDAGRRLRDHGVFRGAGARRASCSARASRC